MDLSRHASGHPRTLLFGAGGRALLRFTPSGLWGWVRGFATICAPSGVWGGRGRRWPGWIEGWRRGWVGKRTLPARVWHGLFLPLLKPWPVHGHPHPETRDQDPTNRTTFGRQAHNALLCNAPGGAAESEKAFKRHGKARISGINQLHIPKIPDEKLSLYLSLSKNPTTPGSFHFIQVKFAALPQGKPWFVAPLACVKHAASVRPEPGSNSP
jgi:hypothetical protein